MKYYIHESLSLVKAHDAYKKARVDTEKILEKNGFSPINVVSEYSNVDRNSFSKRIKRHFSINKVWKNATKDLKKGDFLFIQYPEDNDSAVLFNALNRLKRKGIKTIALIHDLDVIRYGQKSIGGTGYNNIAWQIKKIIEVKKIKSFVYSIALNDTMKDLMNREYNIPMSNIFPLVIWDYLIEDFKEKEFDDLDNRVIIAGNLNKKKVSYLADLPEDVNFELYGDGYVDTNSKNIHYNGSFAPEELTSALKGSFGLVWDGDSSKTCTGKFGSYLRINNPHKTSLYLSSGIPVIIWEEAALSKFILENKCGITVSSLFDINDKISKLSKEEYLELRNNALKVSEKMREGYFLGKVLKEITK